MYDRIKTGYQWTTCIYQTLLSQRHTDRMPTFPPRHLSCFHAIIMYVCM